MNTSKTTVLFGVPTTLCSEFKKYAHQYRFICAPSEDEIVRQIHHHTIPDIFILDKEVCSLEFIQKLRTNVTISAVPIIVLGVSQELSTVREVINAGADDYLPKPLDVLELFRVIEMRLHRRILLESYLQHTLKNMRQHLAKVLPHEFRTPMTTIWGGIRFMRENLNNLTAQDTHELLNMTGNAVERLQRLMEKILLYANLELLYEDQSMKGDIEEATTENFRDQVTDTILSVAVEAERKDDVRIRWLVPAHYSVSIKSFYLTKLLYELMDNACKFSSAGTPIDVIVYLRQNKCVFVVRDYGRGMSPEQVNELRAFTQFDRQLHEQQGIGLGFAIIKIITVLFGGTYSVHSKKDSGTTVFIELSARSTAVNDNEFLHDSATPFLNEILEQTYTPYAAISV